MLLLLAMKRSFPPNEDESRPKPPIYNLNQAATELLRYFLDIASLGVPSEVCVYHQTTQTTVNQCRIRIRFLESETNRIQLNPSGKTVQNVGGLEFVSKTLSPQDRALLSEYRSEINDLATQIEQLRKMRRACVERMLAICLGLNGRERRSTYKLFKASVSDTFPFHEGDSEMRILRQTPCWLYWGSWR